MMDCFSPTFSKLFGRNIKSINLKFSTFYSKVYIISVLTSVFIRYENGCKHSLYLVTGWKIQLEYKLSCKVQNKILLGSLCCYRHVTDIVA